MPGESALDAIVAGEADIALVSNALPYRDSVAAVIPLFPTVLHIGYLGDHEVPDIETLLDGARVFAGDIGSASRLMFLRSLDITGVTPDTFTFVDDPEVDRPTVFVVFSPIAPDVLREFQSAQAIRLYSAGSPEDAGRGSSIERYPGDTKGGRPT